MTMDQAITIIENRRAALLRLHHDALHVEAVAVGEALVKAPRAIVAVMLCRLFSSLCGKPCDDLFDVLCAVPVRDHDGILHHDNDQIFDTHDRRHYASV
ncbi:hypothetical protein JK185_03030 [Gluconobacter wancherniae]|nr:hypothetical protein [Gluconobacter wancherniae]